MILTLVSPISSRTYRSASHAIAKQSAKSADRYREATNRDVHLGDNAHNWT
ncbi:MAG: hypothetical protein JWP68_1298 [Modestobacter sp.]|nr:hypothetical protein [Modestobacter sp.]